MMMMTHPSIGNGFFMCLSIGIVERCGHGETRPCLGYKFTYDHCRFLSCVGFGRQHSTTRAPRLLAAQALAN